MRTHRMRTLVATLAACGAVVMAGCSTKSTAPAPAAGTPPPGAVFDFAFRMTGTSDTYTFAQAGDWRYFCRKHGVDGMTGTIFVRETSGRDSLVVSVGASGQKRFSPDTVTIKPNGTIRWVNVSSDIEHTATSR